MTRDEILNKLKSLKPTAFPTYKYTIKHPLKVQHEFQLSPVGIPIKMQVK